MDDSQNNQIAQERVDSDYSDSRKQKNNKNIKIVVFVILGILLLVGAGVAGYFIFKYVEKTNSDISGLNESVKTNSNTLTELGKKSDLINSKLEAVSAAQDSIKTQTGYDASYVPQYANMTIEKIIEDKNSALEDGFRFLLLDLKLENTTKETVYFSGGELRLKDLDNYEFGLYDPTSYKNDFVKTKVILPDNRLTFPYQSVYLNPGETLRGTVVFVINKPSTKFILYRNNEKLREINL